MRLYESMLNFEIYQILWCQNVLQPVEKLLSFFSVFTKMATVYSYVFPLLYLHSPEFYIRTLLTSICSNIVMILLKWIVSEGRPYWYVFSMENRPILRQTEITCETSSGNPSGHVMFQAAFLYLILTELMNQLHRRKCFTKKTSKILGWFVYLCLINMVALSRMYFACHFFHQCLLGAILGHFIARYTVRNTAGMEKMYEFSKLRMLAIGIIVAATAASVFFGQKLFGRDPLWSIKIAFNRCENPLYLKPDSTPVFAIIKDLGLFSGIILSAPLKARFTNHSHWSVKCCVVVLTIIGYQSAISAIPHNRGVLTYYCCSYFIHLFSVFVLLNYDLIRRSVNQRFLT
ncbi:Glucose-6-phosphatase catalytic subunit 1, partial [Pseudolycoriella hygida]